GPTSGQRAVHGHATGPAQRHRPGLQPHEVLEGAHEPSVGGPLTAGRADGTVRRTPRRPAAPPRASHALPHGDPTCAHGTACDAHHPGVRSAAVRRRPDPGASSDPEETLMARTSFRTSVAAVLGVAGTAVGALAAHDLTQKRHTILRIYPVIGHMRYLLEGLRPELQQYFIERNWDGRPFDRDVRSIVYEWAKGI